MAPLATKFGTMTSVTATSHIYCVRVLKCCFEDEMTVCRVYRLAKYAVTREYNLFHVFIGIIVLLSLQLPSLQLLRDTVVMTHIDRHILFINLNSVSWFPRVAIDLGQRAASTATAWRDGSIATSAGANAFAADFDGLGLVAHSFDVFATG
ncbi:hypothetical protein F52700_544 [Fusarium sp. NRRL 52700]|nr:hypothetical protein F52700_544 [Fusarium sp. NRRL 52700]